MDITIRPLHAQLVSALLTYPKAREGAWVFPKQSNLAQILGVCARTVERLVHDLRAAGILLVRSVRPQPFRRYNHYQVILDRWHLIAPTLRRRASSVVVVQGGLPAASCVGSGADLATPPAPCAVTREIPLDVPILSVPPHVGADADVEEWSQTSVPMADTTATQHDTKVLHFPKQPVHVGTDNLSQSRRGQESAPQVVDHLSVTARLHDLGLGAPVEWIAWISARTTNRAHGHAWLDRLLHMAGSPQGLHKAFLSRCRHLAEQAWSWVEAQQQPVASPRATAADASESAPVTKALSSTDWQARTQAVDGALQQLGVADITRSMPGVPALRFRWLVLAGTYTGDDLAERIKATLPMACCR